MRKRISVVLCDFFNSIENYVGKMNSNTDIISNDFFKVPNKEKMKKYTKLLSMDINLSKIINLKSFISVSLKY